MVRPGQLAERADLARMMLDEIPAGASVAGSYGLLPSLSSRSGLYSLNYHFLGLTQFAERPYVLPDGVRFLAVDTEEFIRYAAQFPTVSWMAPGYGGGFGRLRRAAGESVFSLGHFQLYDRSAGNYRPPVGADVGKASTGSLADGLRLLGAEATAVRNFGDGFPTLTVATSWAADREIADDFMVVLSLVDSEGQVVWERTYPFGGGLMSAADLSPAAGRPLESRIRAPLFGVPDGDYGLRLSLRPVSGGEAILNRFGTTILRLDGSTSVGDVDLGTVTVP